MLSLKLIDLSGLDNINNTFSGIQHQVVSAAPVDGGSGFMPRETDVETERRRAREGRALATAFAAERDKQIRNQSVARDLQLGYPVSVPQPDGEEFPRKCQMQLRSHDQSAEILKGFIQGPPNKTICNSSVWGDPIGGGGSGFELKETPTTKSNSCSCLNPPEPKSHSTGQLNSWNFLKPSSSSGKASPPHNRSGKCHIHSSRSPKGGSSPVTTSKYKQPTSSTSPSPSASTCSSPFSSTSGLASTGASTATIHHHKPTLSEKIHNMFSDKTQSSPTPTHASSGSGMFARLLSDENKSKSKSLKTSGKGAGSYSGIKDLKKIPSTLLPQTEAHVYVMIPTKETSGGKKSGAGVREQKTNVHLTLDDPYSSTSESRSQKGHLSEKILSYALETEESGLMTPSDKNGNARLDSPLVSSSCFLPFPRNYEDGQCQGSISPRRSEENCSLDRERAYSDSMIRSDRSSLLRSEISESRMSLCIESDDPSGQPTTTMTFESREGVVMTESDGRPSLPPLGDPSMESMTTAQESPSSFLYHHHQFHHHQVESQYSSSMNVSTTPPPPPFLEGRNDLRISHELLPLDS